MKPAGKNLIFQKCPVQNQVGGSDCGLFAMAFAVSICLGVNPSKFIYDQEKMRRHLTECLENQKFSNFPFSVNTNWKKQVANKTGLSSLSIFQETRWLVCNLLESVSLALKVTVKCCKSNYLR